MLKDVKGVCLKCLKYTCEHCEPPKEEKIDEKVKVNTKK